MYNSVEYGIDVTHVQFIDRRILDEGKIAELRESLEPVIEKNGGRLGLCNVDPGIREVFEITQLTKVFDIS